MSNSEALKATAQSSFPSFGFGETANPSKSQEQANTTLPATPHVLPSVSLPKAGGAIRGIGEKFVSSPATGAGSFTVPVNTSTGRPGTGLELELVYSSGSGNGPFGIGWDLSTHSIVRKTDKGLPKYRDEEESDTFLLSGAEDLVPQLELKANGSFGKVKPETRYVNGENFNVSRYQPRIESTFSRIVKFTNAQSQEVHWEVKSPTNVTTIFGDNDNSRVFDPQNPSRVFEWLPSRSYDDKGNAIHYEYKSEDSHGVDPDALHESHRTNLIRSTAKYLKRIRYGNTVSRLSQDLRNTDWMFEVVFDYGDHDNEKPTSAESKPWLMRADPFSSYRSGFEIRQYRLCRRILMFHHFPHETNIGQNCVISSLNLIYEEIDQRHSSSLAITTVLKSVTQQHWLRSDTTYQVEALPPIEFGYTQAHIAKFTQDIDLQSLSNLPAGLTDTYQFVDLEGQGLTGIVSSLDGALMYIPNLGNGQFGFAKPLPANPDSVSRYGTQQWMDLSGSGKVDLVQLQGPNSGFHKRNWDQASGWDHFRSFVDLPNVSWDNKNLKFIDLTGDGLADVLIAEDDLFTMYYGKGESGFDKPHRVPMALDDQNGPRLVFFDGFEVIYTADMNGDGLADLVRIRNREVCYWPNYGYGRFGAKVVMTNSPEFDYSESFDQSLLRLADINGTGAIDIIYLGGRVPKMYMNLSGNGWSDAKPISSFPGMDQAKNIQIVDLLGKGTACLAWSSTLPGDAGRHLRYLDLMADGKPFLLSSVDNNLGWETQISYASSTEFYARDKKAQKPWSSHLPFPVQCVERLTSIDRISGNVFETTYAYHDGYFDGIEREFRGFGMVESRDAERYANHPSLRDFSNTHPSYHLPPVLTKTWYHTGEYRNGRQITAPEEMQYLDAMGLSDEEAKILSIPSTKLPTSIVTATGHIPHEPSEQECREACRALKGSILRSEVYSLDGSDLEILPYNVTESNFVIEQRQPLASNLHAIFLVRPLEIIALAYDRKLYRVKNKERPDPRVSHTLLLETDYFGNALSTMVLNYGRRFEDSGQHLTAADRIKQMKTYATLTLAEYTNSIDVPDAYLLPKPAESRLYEVVNLSSCVDQQNQNSIQIISIQDSFHILQLLSSGQFDIPFENFEGPYPSNSRTFRRLLKRSRSLYRANDLTGPLELGLLESLALPYQTFQLAYTTEQIDLFTRSGKITNDAINQVFGIESGYIQFDGDSSWWSQSGEVFYSANRNDSPEQELQEAKDHFFLARRSRAPFDSNDKPCEIVYNYDAYDLMIEQVTDPLGNATTVGERNMDSSKPLDKHGHDYRTLAPFLVMDPNRNRSQVAFDVAGNVTAVAAMGKPEEALGDSLDGVDVVVREKDKKAYFDNPIDWAAKLLGTATARTVYDVHAYHRTKHEANPQPVWSSGLARKTHISDLDEGARSQVLATFTFSDGSGRIVQEKTQCEPGPLGNPASDPTPQRTQEANRWLTSSWTVFNNKNNPVKKYEPFFSSTHQFEDNAIQGVTPIFIYDAMSRNIATIYPDHTWTKVIVDPWSSVQWDQNDTVLIQNVAADKDVGPFVKRLPAADYLPTWYEERMMGNIGDEVEAAKKAAAHADTPSFSYFDPLGREFVGFETLRSFHKDGKSRGDEVIRQTVILDIQGLQFRVEDALFRTVEESVYNSSSAIIKQTNMDKGERWVLNDVLNNPIYSWDGREQRFRTIYDQNRRSIGLYLQRGDDAEQLVEKTEYGETSHDSELYNLRERTCAVFNQSGITRMAQYDFKGNLLASTRLLSKDFRGTTDWNTTIDLEDETFEESMSYDALNRRIKVVLPDGTTNAYTFNERGLLRSISTKLKNSGATTGTIQNIEYDAKGQRTSVQYGNGVKSRATYDPKTFLLRRILSTRDRKDKSPNRDGSPNRNRREERLQDMRYTYDASGNMARIKDETKQDIYFRNRVVEASQTFEYDSLYRLVEATGREHLGQHKSSSDTKLNHQNDSNAVGRYVEKYEYDAVGNILKLRHRNLSDGGSWTRHYFYHEKSLIDASTVNNRLSNTCVGESTEFYQYDGLQGVHGNMTSLPGLCMEYDFEDRMSSSVQTKYSNDDTGYREITYYRYDSTGKRVRKTTERQTDNSHPIRLTETLYISEGYEVFRRYHGKGEVSIELRTISATDSGKRFLLIENRITGGDVRAPKQIFRYQLGNHQGSAITELDQDGKLISYEEYTPYGVSSLRSTYQQTEVPKRYRFLGKERDESGLDHLGARYYAAWLGRFISADPAGLVDGTNLYQYARSNPVRFSDGSGFQSRPDAPLICADPSSPTPNEEAAQASLLSEAEAHQEVLSSEMPPPEEMVSKTPVKTTSQQPQTPKSWVEPPPPVSPTDYTLYVPEGFVHAQAEAALNEAFYGNEAWYTRTGFFVLGTLASPLALAEEYIARPVANIPFAVHNSGIKIGEHAARAVLWAEQGEGLEATVDALHSVVAFSEGFVILASLLMPLASKGGAPRANSGGGRRGGGGGGRGAPPPPPEPLPGSGPIPRSVGAMSRAEALARKYKMNADSPTTQQVLNNLDMRLSDFIGKFRQGKIWKELGDEFASNSSMTVEEALATGKKAQKLLVNGRFAKGSNYIGGRN